MALRKALTLIVVLACATLPATASPTEVRGPFLLTTLPTMGTVTWRCDPSRQPSAALAFHGLALGFSASKGSTNSRVRLHVGPRTVVSRDVPPGRSIQLPYTRTRVQQLDIVQKTGAGTLRAYITVTFVTPGTSTYCYAYLPPRIEVRVLPRG